MITNSIITTYQDEVLYAWDKDDDFTTLCGDEALEFFNSFREYALQQGYYFVRYNVIVDMRAVKTINAKGNIDLGLQMPWIPDPFFVEFYEAWKLGLHITRKDKDYIIRIQDRNVFWNIQRENIIEMMDSALICNAPEEMTVKELYLIRHVLREEIL